MTDKQPEALIRADELEAIGAESSLARAMAAHTIRLLYKENARLHEVNAELVEALKLIQIECDNLHHSKDHRHTYAESCKAKVWIDSVLAKAQGENND